MNLSEVRTFHSVDLRDRWYDRDPVCAYRDKSVDKANRPFKAVVLNYDLPKVSIAGMDYILGFLTSLVDLRKAKA
eukprot:5505022-Prorocentrum_lima.AAC.1